ncbi:hypothetical protein GCM10007112_18420 [Vulcanisaeta souniana JCM 11219]|uniref:Uncharacterized protein n=1 Tax=Vulcanisaeta souniana JCM 11219 TaxID=1293586 RepID=A0A830E4F2_9CREN|nr:hypothetical protein GCM10007112_18420 [Vulcanisaeta souniana JCM 11219]
MGNEIVVFGGRRITVGYDTNAPVIGGPAYTPIVKLIGLFDRFVMFKINSKLLPVWVYV